MRVARGLFRLWVVVSACWLIVSATLTWEMLLEAPSLPKVAGNRGYKIEEARRQGYSDKEIADYLGVDLRPNWKRRLTAVGVIIGPPIVVLALGFGLLWAARGFREQ